MDRAMFAGFPLTFWLRMAPVEAAKCVDFGHITPQAAKGGWQI
jgi:hypothetical protein